MRALYEVRGVGSRVKRFTTSRKMCSGVHAVHARQCAVTRPYAPGVIAFTVPDHLSLRGSGAISAVCGATLIGRVRPPQHSAAIASAML